MTLREKAVAIATLFEGRCTCANMDGGVDCPWCKVYLDVLQGRPLEPTHGRPAPVPAAGAP